MEGLLLVIILILILIIILFVFHCGSTIRSASDYGVSVASGVPPLTASAETVATSPSSSSDFSS
jgi:hypothetical protein